MPTITSAFTALSTAALVAVSGATYAQYVSEIQQQNHGDATCTSFQYTSVGDPHIVTYNAGNESESVRNENLPNFVTVENSAGGATTISTATKTWAYNTATTLNNQIIVKQANWTLTTGLTTTGNNGKIKPSVTDASGTHKLKEGDSLLEPDGTVISYVNGAIDIGQRLTWGGNTLIEIKAYTAGGQSGLDVGITGKGDAVLNGTAAQQGTGSTASLLYSCKAADSTFTGQGWQFLDGSNYAYNGTQNRVYSDVTGNAGYGNASL